jgi:hypothetical protein
LKRRVALLIDAAIFSIFTQLRRRRKTARRRGAVAFGLVASKIAFVGDRF